MTDPIGTPPSIEERADLIYLREYGWFDPSARKTMAWSTIRLNVAVADLGASLYPHRWALLFWTLGMIFIQLWFR